MCRPCRTKKKGYDVNPIHVGAEGYVQIKVNDGRRWVAEHILKAEKAIGRRLAKNEVVHHINYNKGDNRNENLLICTKSYHHWLHNRMAYLYAKEHFC